MYKDIFSTLIKEFYTTQDIHLATGLLKEFFNIHLFKSGQHEDYRTDLKKFLKEHDDAEHMGRRLLSFNDSFYKHFTKDSVADIFKALESEIETHPQVILYIPALLPDEETKKLGEWFRKNVEADVLLDLKVDRLAIGGCMFVWKGVYYDFSLRYFLKKKEKEVTAAIRSYRKEHVSR